MSESKYRNKITEVDGIKFDSKDEARYYENLKLRQANGEIEGFELQPVFELQPSFRKNGVLYRAITYKADFLVYLPDGKTEVIDVKGMRTETFNVKKKMFEYRYPDLHLRLMAYSKKYGGWIEVEELEKLRKEAKKAKA